MTINKNQLLQVSTSDGLYLHGYYSPSSDKKIALLHIHGFEGNFYETSFVYTLEKKLSKNNIAFLTVNTRGNGMVTEFNTVDGKYRTIGSHKELLEEAHLDISAWIKFLINEGYQKIILQGHSLGTMKVIRYLFEGKYKDKIKKLILLAPFEKTLLDNISPETQEGWAGDNDFARVFDFTSRNYDFPILKQIKVPTKIIVGDKDEYLLPSEPGNYQKAMDILLNNIPNSEGIFIPDAIHSFKPNEELMSEEVVKFIKD